MITAQGEFGTANGTPTQNCVSFLKCAACSHPVGVRGYVRVSMHKNIN
jgi:hypothetical protein